MNPKLCNKIQIVGMFNFKLIVADLQRALRDNANRAILIAKYSHSQ